MQFVTFLGNALQGNFGISLRLGRPVSALLAERLPATLELAITAAIISLVVGIPVGVYTALRRDSWISRAMLTTSLIGVSLPNFLIGILLILIFAVWLGVLPSFGRGDTVMVGSWSTGLLTATGLKALILPAITLGFFPLTLIMRLVRAEMLEVLRTDYIKFARARGLSDRAVHFGHALKNTLVPVITIAGLQLGGIIAFAIITETGVPVARHGAAVHPGGAVRRHPGDGGLPLPDRRSSSSSINLVVDMLYYVVDPRLRIEGGGGRGARMSAVLRRFFDGDIFYSFRRSPLVIAAAVLTVGCILGRGVRALGRAAQPFRPAHAQPARRLHAAGVDASAATRTTSLGTDDQGRDVLSTIIFGSRMSLLIGAAGDAARHGDRRVARASSAATSAARSTPSSCASPTCSSPSPPSSSRC